MPERAGVAAAAGCRFCAIVAGERDGHVVFEDEISLAFLDNRPLFPGHSLLVPREHHEAIWDLPDELVGPLFANARLLVGGDPRRDGRPGRLRRHEQRRQPVGPPPHVHVVPRNRKDGLRGFFWPRRKYESDEHMAETAEAVRAAVARSGSGLSSAA